MEAFVYCWTDHQTNKLYVGYHKGTVDDGYICSSKIMLKEYENRPKDFTRQIISTGSSEEMRILECKILQSVKAHLNEDFYNQHNGNGKFVCLSHSEKSKQKISQSNKGSKRSEETKQKMREARSKQITTDETRRKQSESAKKRANSEDGKKHLKSIAHLGMKRRLENGPILITEDSKKKTSEKIKKMWQEGYYTNRKTRSDKGKKRRRDSDFR